MNIPNQVAPAGGGLISPRSKASQPGIRPIFAPLTVIVRATFKHP
jgi:hypothetical protein